jgi:hypothetical protein
MNLRHAAAIALVGWYLMVPPPNVRGILMTSWKRRAVFDTKAQRESAATGWSRQRGILGAYFEAEM